ncbi:MAG: hypothetical protein CL819_08985 [Croceicoccus sp.]|nr:hypothetical protein [Croceicoccus sp.]
MPETQTMLTNATDTTARTLRNLRPGLFVRVTHWDSSQTYAVTSAPNPRWGDPAQLSNAINNRLEIRTAHDGTVWAYYNGSDHGQEVTGLRFCAEGIPARFR